MGVKDAFLRIKREDNKDIPVKERITNFDEFHIALPQEKRIAQASRCMNCGIPYCGFGKEIEGMTVGCPLHNMCPEFNDALSKKKYGLALSRLLKTNPFPEFTSRVCPALCEKACVEGLNFEAVSTKDNEHEIIEYAFENGLIKPRTDIGRNGKKVVVVGSGPSGLACANELNVKGYEVTVLEKNDRFGGLLMYGIPNMKLDKKVIDRRVEILQAEGVKFLKNTYIKTKAQANKLLKEYDAVVLACGSEKPRRINVENEDAKGVYFAVDFLTKTTKALLDNKPFELDVKDKNVVVVGGGDTGNDCVATTIRMGCKSVVQLEMMSEPPTKRMANNPWPTWPLVKKTDYGQLEAIELFKKDPRVYNTTIDSIKLKDDKVESVSIVKVEKEVVDGKVNFNKVKGSKKNLPCDLLLIAAGFIGFNEELEKAFSIESRQGRVSCKDHKIKDNLFVCGDMEMGQSLVVKALASGIDCAKSIDKYLND